VEVGDAPDEERMVGISEIEQSPVVGGEGWCGADGE